MNIKNNKPIDIVLTLIAIILWIGVFIVCIAGALLGIGV